MKKIFSFWETVKGFDIKVLNEREVRAAAGILFVFAIIAFMNSWLLWNFTYTKIFVIYFLFDFFIRLFINPKFAPSLILAKIIVWKQEVEYVWAPQKRFAWWVWFILGLIILYTLVLSNIVWPQNMIICVLCLVLFAFESMFGICIWCKIYNIFNKNKSQLCAWWVCKNTKKEDIQKVWFIQIITLFIWIVGIVLLLNYKNMFDTNIKAYDTKNINNNNIKIYNAKDNIQNTTKDDCVVPNWAKAIWHKKLWKKHHGCE